MTRTHRFLGGVVLGYAHLVLVTVVGLWMTPFLLRRLGQDTLGLWLIAQQLLGYLLLMDLGVTALLPREAAFATGRAGGVVGGLTEVGDLPTVVARARQVVSWQVPVVAAAALASWAWMPRGWYAAAGPLGLMLACFVLLFPMRLFQAFLQGVQELPFLSRVQIASWSAGAATTVVLVLAGAGLYSLIVGWAVSQTLTVGPAWLRVSRRYRTSWPSWHVRPGWHDVKLYLTQASWISVAQVAQVFLTGSDLLLVGAVLGAGPVVLYSCTGKLSMVLSNHPQLIMQMATPALSEMRASDKKEQLLDVSVALMLAMLTISGLVASVVLALNGSFVRWWVGVALYGGHQLTVLFSLLLILRHWNITLIYGLFCFGQERRISITNLADGTVALLLGFSLIYMLGAAGAIVGSMVAVCLVSLPANLIALGRQTGTTPLKLCSRLWPWFWRFAIVSTACGLLPLMWAPDGVAGMILTGALVAAVYIVTMVQGLAGGPLGTYAKPRLLSVLPADWQLKLSSARP
jgi:O-antigen/teichoic acid export membrane protein